MTKQEHSSQILKPTWLRYETRPTGEFAPGQGPDPRAVKAVPKDFANAFLRCTGISVRDIPDLDDATAYTGAVAQPLHILRTATARHNLDEQLEKLDKHPLSSRQNVVRSFASLTEFEGFRAVGAWDFETTLEAAKTRGKASDQLATKYGPHFGMLATFYASITQDGQSPQEPLWDALRRIVGHKGDLEEHQLMPGVYAGSYASPGMVTLTGLKTELEKVRELLRPQRNIIKATLLGRINWAYHSKYAEELCATMDDFTAQASIKDPDPNRGILISPTTGLPVQTREDIITISRELIRLPVNQTASFGYIRSMLEQSDLPVLPGIEPGNSRDYPWGNQQGVQTACLYDATSKNPFTNRDGRPIDLPTVTVDGSPEDLHSKLFVQFCMRYL